MRIISGEWKGRRLPAGLPDGVRPTLDAARETIYNILSSRFDIEGAAVCDICAGSGALGLEALSRGASHCTFVEKNPKVIRWLRATLSEICPDSVRYTIIHADAFDFLSTVQRESFHLIFTDPPYPLRIAGRIVGTIADTNALAQDGMLIVERSNFESIISHSGLELINSRVFGETTVDFFSKQQ